MRIVVVAVLALTVILGGKDPVFAQLPLATGRQFTLSNSAWKLFIPDTFYLRPGDISDVLIHFHGDPQTYWNNAKYAKLNVMIVTVNYNGLSSAYSSPFAANTALFQSILNEALTRARQQPDIPDSLAWDRLSVSSFSAGYGAVREILKNSSYRNDIDTLLAADSLYASTAGDDTPLDAQMANYKAFATLAKNGSKTFLFSHSQVPTYTYESTGECGDELMQHLGIAATVYNANGLGTLSYYRYAESGNFRLWGATGADGDSHLEHLRYIGDFLEEMPLAKLTPGDYNNSGVVDAADYVAWRNHSSGALMNEEVSPGQVDVDDYMFWRSRFGTSTSGSSTAAGQSIANGVPEPAGLCGILYCLGALAWSRVICPY